MTVLRRLAKNCEYGELTDSIIKDWIVEGKTMIARGQGYFARKILWLQRSIEVCKSAEVANEHMKTLTDQSAKDKEIDALKGKHYPYNCKQSTCGRCGRGNHG